MKVLMCGFSLYRNSMICSQGIHFVHLSMGGQTPQWCFIAALFFAENEIICYYKGASVFKPPPQNHINFPLQQHIR